MKPWTGARLKRVRLQTGLKQKSFSQMLGMDYHKYAHLEVKKRIRFDRLYEMFFRLLEQYSKAWVKKPLPGRIKKESIDALKRYVTSSMDELVGKMIFYFGARK